MMSRSRLLLCVMFLVSANALSQDVDLRLRSSYGFDGIVRPGEWNPLYLSLTNLGDPLSATLSLEVIVSPGAPNNETTLMVTEDIELGKGESLARRFVLPVARGSLPVTLRVTGSPGSILEEEIVPPLRYSPERVLVALSSGAIESLGGVAVAYPLLEHLPDAWHGYAPVDLIILADPPLERLSPLQWDALQEWVRLGGSLLILAREATPPATEARLTALWESGTAPPESGEAGEIATRRLGEGALYRTESSRALRAETVLGLLRDEGSRGEDAPPLENRRRPFTDSAVAALLEDTLYRYPSRWLMGIIFVAAALSLALLTRQGTAAPRMSLLSPLLLPAALAAILALLFGTTAAPPAGVAVEVQRAVAEEPDATSVRLSRDLLLMSARARPYEVELPREVVLLSNAGRRNRVERVAGGSLAINGELEEWDRRFLSTWERRPLQLSVELLADEGAIRIENGEHTLLEESALVTSWHTYSTGPVSPGQQVSRSVREESESDLSSKARRYVFELRKDEELRELLRDGALFVAWTSPLAEAYTPAPRFESGAVEAVIVIPLKGAPPR